MSNGLSFASSADHLCACRSLLGDRPDLTEQSTKGIGSRMFRSRLDLLARRSLLRHLRVVESAPGSQIEIEGRKVISFSSNNYLDLATHPKVIEAASCALRQYGVGAGASRLIAGTFRPHAELEEDLAAFKRTAAALVFSTGYQANLGLIQTLAEDRTRIYADRLCHASLIEACRLCTADLRVYRHRDVPQLEHLLGGRPSAQPALIVTDGVFSMDGDLAPLPELLKATEARGALLVVDDAHGTGVLGRKGRGTVEHFGVESSLLVEMGTLSKAFGGFGGFVAGPRDLIDFLFNRARAFVYTTALPPAMAAAASAALRIIQNEPERRARLWKLRQHLYDGLRLIGFAIPESESPIIPLLVGDTDATLRLSEYLFSRGIYAPAIRPPTVPSGTGRIRFSVTAGHSAAQINQLLEILCDIRTQDPPLWCQLTTPANAAQQKGRRFL
jgi:8-amino-7-oxononanoate synthase